MTTVTHPHHSQHTHTGTTPTVGYWSWGAAELARTVTGGIGEGDNRAGVRRVPSERPTEQSDIDAEVTSDPLMLRAKNILPRKRYCNSNLLVYRYDSGKDPRS